MSSPSLYNRWRPRTFAERDDNPLIGQEHVTRTLRNAVAGGQIAHAYLLCGPRGTGKTSAARILARAVNCKRGLRGEPCNQCQNCQALLNGRQLDLLIEIDGASNRGVDDVRQLRERLMQRPGGADLTGRYKVYIIDEVHMLTTEAFNALLKSLEEPPPHVIFVLATTDPQKVPATVASRCQRFDFRPIPVETLARHLAHIAGEEGVRIEPAGLELLARSAAGGARDAVSLLDQTLAFAGTAVEGGGAGTPAPPVTVTAQQVQAMLGLTDFDAVCRLIDSVGAGDLPAGLRLVQEVSSKGGDLRQFTRQVLEFLRAVLLAASDAVELVPLDEETRDAVQQRARHLSLAEVVRIIKIFSQAEHGLKSPSAQPQLPLELAVVEAVIGPRPVISAPAAAPLEARAVISPTQRADRVAPPEPAGWVDGAGLPVRPPAGAGPRAAGSVSPPEPAEPFPSPAEAQGAWVPPVSGTELIPPDASVAAVAEVVPPAAPPADPLFQGSVMTGAVQLPASIGASEIDGSRSVDVVEDTGSPPSRRESASDVTIEAVKGHWMAVLDEVRHKSKALEAVLKDAAPSRVEAGGSAPVVVLSFGFPFHAAKAQDGANLVIIQRALSRTLGVRATVRCEVGEPAGGKVERMRNTSGPEDPVITKAMRIMNARVMAPEEVAAIQAFPVTSLETIDD
jgi:DNA polymerase III subunit gamma/tau